MALAVVVVLAVRLVVLLVVRHEVVEREAVVRGDEVDRRDGLAPAVLVEVGRAREPARELGQRRGLAAPEVAHRVAVAPVPLRPQGREAAHLVATVAEVPRLGDELDLGDDRVLLHDVEERREAVDLVELARERGREVEAEPVHVHLGHPVPQRVHDGLEHVRRAHEQRVARAGRVEVVRLVAVHEPVVGLVVDAAEAQRRAEVVALRGVVVDHVEDDLDAGLVQSLDHGLELHDLLPARPVGRVPVVGREEPDGVVTPVVRQPLLDERGVVDELVHRHELDRRDAQRHEVLDDGRVRHARVGAAQLVGDVRVEHRHALDVRLVDDAVVVVPVRRAVVAPVEERVDDDRHHRVPGRVVVVEQGERAGVRRPPRPRRARPPARPRPRRRNGRRTATRRRRSAPRSPSRTGRAGASPGCSGGRSRGRRDRARGSRSACRGPCPGV